MKYKNDGYSVVTPCLARNSLSIYLIYNILLQGRDKRDKTMADKLIYPQKMI